MDDPQTGSKMDNLQASIDLIIKRLDRMDEERIGERKKYEEDRKKDEEERVFEKKKYEADREANDKLHKEHTERMDKMQASIDRILYNMEKRERQKEENLARLQQAWDEGSNMLQYVLMYLWHHKGTSIPPSSLSARLKVE
jgi:hypothetical protein